MDTTAIVKHFATTHNSGEHKFKAQVATLRKVAQRAVESWEQAPIRGADAKPYVHDRLAKFCSALETGAVPAADVDLLPASHPAREQATDPWAALESAEDRLASLAKSAIGAVSRTALRKQSTDEISTTHRRLAHLHTHNFQGNAHQVSATGIERAGLVKAAAAVHEELERRGVEISPQHDLYAEALQLRSTPSTEMTKGTIYQTDGVVLLDMPGLGLLALPQRRQVTDLAKAANVWHPEGSQWHYAMREPEELVYAVRLSNGAEPAAQALIGEFNFTKGAVTKDFTEVFVSGAMNGVLIVGSETLTLRKGGQPYVLTAAAVAAGWMPPDGESAIPTSLELAVPLQLRFWKAAEGEDAREIRDYLVKSNLLAADNICLVGGQLRRVVAKRYLADTYPAAPSTFAHAVTEVSAPDELAIEMSTTVIKAQAAGEALLAGGQLPEGTACILVDKAVDAEELIAKLVALAPEEYCLGAPDSAEMRKAMSAVGRPFMLNGEGIFVASRHIEGVDYVPVSPAAQNVTKGNVRLLKSADTELRYVLGVVLEPETEDAQADIYSADEIRKSAHTFLSDFRNVGLQHSALVNDKVRIVESYLSPADFAINGQLVKAGTWMLGVIVDDDDIWAAVKAGDVTGFSIGGSGIRTPEL